MLHSPQDTPSCPSSPTSQYIPNADIPTMSSIPVYGHVCSYPSTPCTLYVLWIWPSNLISIISWFPHATNLLDKCMPTKNPKNRKNMTSWCCLTCWLIKLWCCKMMPLVNKSADWTPNYHKIVSGSIYVTSTWSSFLLEGNETKGLYQISTIMGISSPGTYIGI